MRHTQGWVLLLTGLLSQAAWGQSGLGPMIQEVYQRTKSARTAEDFGAIVDRCEQLRGQTENAERVSYLTSLLAWALNKRGELYAEKAAAAAEAAAAQEFDARALEDFEAAVANDPRRWRAVHNRGVSMALAGRHEEAEADFARTVELNPKYANAWFNRAEIRFEVGKYAEALGDYEQTLRLSPRDSQALRGRGMCRLQMGQYQVAVEDLTTALRAAEGTAAASIRVGRGQAHQALRQWPQAAEDFRQAVAADNDSSDAYRAAAWLMAVCPDQRLRNADLAVEAAQQAAQLEQQRWGGVSAQCLDTLAAAYANQGDADKAAEYAQQALQRADQLDKAARDAIRSRLELYRQGQPFRLAAAASATLR